MAVILIRHGRVDKVQGLPLSPAGLAFANGLAGTLSTHNIRKILSPSAAHCVATVAPLAQSLNLSVENYSSDREITAALAQGDWAINDMVVLFRYGNMSSVFNALGVGGSCPGSSDEAYGNMWLVNPYNHTVSASATGF